MDAPSSGCGISVEDIQRKVSEVYFGKPLITNVLRGHVAEAIIATALEPAWIWCSADYSPWDFERADGVRIEVKQSAARQSWWVRGDKPSASSFDIAARKQDWEDGVGWVDKPGRRAQIYILAHHHIDDDSADHRAPDQWVFYVIAASALPATRRINIANARRLASPCSYADLRHVVDTLAVTLEIDR